MGGVYDRAKLAADLSTLGVSSGGCLFVHASFKSIGQVDGSVQTVVEALEDAIGPDGVLMMPSFNLVGGRDERAENWDVTKTPSSVGWLTEYFRQMPGTFRSDHYSHSTAARGPGADVFVADHLSQEGMPSPWDREPWGKTYGTGAPMVRAYERGGQILMIGTSHETSTYCHVVEVRYWAERCANDPGAPFIWLDRERLGPYWDVNGIQKRGKVGDADCRLIDIRTYVDGLLSEVRDNPDAYDRVKLGAR